MIMKHNISIPLFTFTFSLHLSLLAAVPLRWTVETSRAQPATFEAYQGETLAFEASLQSAGKPLELSGIAALYWQTNGMGSAYWETTAAVNSNRLSAVWTPEMDVGAKVYNCFIGVPGTIYHAAFQLRLRPSPGATPNALPLPTPVIDFSQVRVLNPPWGSGGVGVDTNAVERIANAAVETNAVTVGLQASVSSLESSKLSKSDVIDPAIATTNGPAADAKATGDGLMNRYTKDETDAKLAEKADINGKMTENFSASTLTVGAVEILVHNGLMVGRSSETGTISLGAFTSIRGGYVIANGQTRGVVDFGDPEAVDYRRSTLTTDGSPVVTSNMMETAVSAHISASDTTFSSEVEKVARTVTPQPSPKLRVYDRVRGCWWLGEMVNGVMQWEVE